jgi:hypothetical protein
MLYLQDKNTCHHRPFIRHPFILPIQVVWVVCVDTGAMDAFIHCCDSFCFFVPLHEGKMENIS